MTSSLSIIERIIATHGFNNAIKLDELISISCKEYDIDFDSIMQRLVPPALFEANERKKIKIANETLKTLKECLLKNNEDIAEALQINTDELSIFLEILSISTFNFSSICVLKNNADEWEATNLTVESTPPFTEGRYLAEPNFMGCVLALYEFNVVKDYPSTTLHIPEDTLSFNDYLGEIGIQWSNLNPKNKIEHLKNYFNEETNKVIQFEEKTNSIYQINIPECNEQIIEIDIDEKPQVVEKEILNLLQVA